MIWSLWRLIYDLEYWIMIHIADDIYNCKEQRPEYAHLVDECVAQNIKPERIVAEVLTKLKAETKLPFWKQKTFWHLLRLNLRKIVRLK